MWMFNSSPVATKFVSIAWIADGSGFYYTRFPEPGSVPPGQESYFSRVCFHRIGDSHPMLSP